MIYLAYVKPYIIKFDNHVELFNTWAYGNVLIMVITISGVANDLSV